MRPNYIKIVIVTGYVLLLSLSVFGIIWIYNELIDYSKTNKPYEQPKELVIITNTLAVLYQTEGAAGLLTIETDLDLKMKYDSLMNTVFTQVDLLKNLSIDEALNLHLDTLNALLLQKKENTESLVQLMDFFETKTIKEITKSTVLSKAERKNLDEIFQNANNQVETSGDTVVVAEKKGFFKRIRDAITSNRPDTTVYISNHLQTHNENVVLPNLTDTIINFIKEVNHTTQERNAFLVRQVVQRQNELYQMNEKTISEINMIVDKIETHEHKSRLQQMEDREATLKRISDLVSIIAYAALAIAIFFMSWTIYSLSASQKLHLEILKAKKVVENLLSAREQLMLMITHDIKAPISSIIGYLELMKKNKPTKKERYYIENMEQSSMHILDLIKDVLDFYSLDHNQQKINPLPFCPSILVTNIFTSFIPEAQRKSLRFERKITIDAKENYVSDPYRIRQILNNLLSNAIKYTPENGSVILSASIESNKNQSLLVVSVKDTGFGIKDVDKKKIFEEFSRLEYTGVGIEGLGLGLNISNKLLQLLGGAIEIDSTFGKGSTFTIRIPLQSSGSIGNENTETNLSKSSHFADNESMNKNIRILFIDDDLVQLNLLAEVTKREGLNASFCSDPLDALQLIHEKEFDIIFSDIQMSGMNGFELVERIRAVIFDYFRRIPIIGLSAHSNISDSQLKEAGFSGFLTKPFTPKQLFETIRTYISFNRESEEFDISENEGFSALTQFAGNDADAAKNIIESFICENKKNLEILKAAFEEGDWKTIADISHKMISLMHMISAKKLVSLLQEYESGSCSEENKWRLFALIEEKIKEAEEVIKRV